MGTDVEKQQGDDSRLDNTQNDGAPEAESAEANPQDQDQEIEIVRTAEPGSSPDRQQLGIRKRVNKLNAKVDAAKEEAAQTSGELQMEREKNRLLELYVQQLKSESEAPKAPNPNDYDDGTSDAQYAKALEDFIASKVDAGVEKRIAAQPKAAPVTDANLVRRQESHYEKAEKLGAKDYAEVEDAAIGVLGNEAVNHIIKASDNSHLILYYLGKNPGQAEEISELIKTDAVKAVWKLGALEKELKVQPRAKQNQAPDPDNELEGASVAGSGDAANSKLKKLLEEAASGKTDYKKYIAAMREERKKVANS